MHLVVLGASRPVVGGFVGGCIYCLNAPGGAGCFLTKNTEDISVYVNMSQCTWWCWVLPDPLGVLSVVPPGEAGPGIATGPKAPLGPGSTLSIKADFAQFSQGSPPTGLPGLRATRCRRGHAGSEVSLSKFSDNEAEMWVTRPGSRYCGYRTCKLLCRAAAHLTRMNDRANT